MADYTARVNLNTKVLDFVQLGGPEYTVGGTVFEMWLGHCEHWYRGPSGKFGPLEVAWELAGLIPQQENALAPSISLSYVQEQPLLDAYGGRHLIRGPQATQQAPSQVQLLESVDHCFNLPRIWHVFLWRRFD